MFYECFPSNIKFRAGKLITESKVKQAGAELCQAQAQVDMMAEVIYQLNSRFGQHWTKVCFVHVQLFQAIKAIFYGR